MERFVFEDRRNAEARRETEDLTEELRRDALVMNLLKRNGIPEKYLQISPWRIKDWSVRAAPCAKCEGLSSCTQKQKGYYENLVFDGILKNEMTACRYMRKELQELAHMKNYLVCDLSENMKKTSLKTIRTDGEDEEYVKLLADVILLSASSKSLYLHGTMGSGKSYLAAAACNDHARNNEKTAFIHYPTFVQRAASGIQQGEYKNEVKRLMYADFLVIDDIGAEAVTEWNRDSILLPVLNARYESGKPVWFTSNYTLNDLQHHFAFSARGGEEITKAARIIERIRASAEIRVLKGKDRRISTGS